MSVASNISLPKLRLSSNKMLSPQIHDFLRKHITEATITPGSLLSENSLSEHFNVSRQPVREALMRLSYEGLLQVLPQRGSVVQKISIQGLQQTIFVRTAIEKECVMNIVRLDSHTKANCLAQLEKVITQQLNCKRDENMHSNYLRLDDLFHEKLCSLSQVPMSWETIQSIKGQMDRIRFLTFDTVSPIEELTAEHQAILKNLEDGNLEECLALLSKHLEQINQTCLPVVERYSEWFTPESLQLFEKLKGAEHK